MKVKNTDGSYSFCNYVAEMPSPLSLPTFIRNFAQYFKNLPLGSTNPNAFYEAKGTSHPLRDADKHELCYSTSMQRPRPYA